MVSSFPTRTHPDKEWQDNSSSRIEESRPNLWPSWCLPSKDQSIRAPQFHTQWTSWMESSVILSLVVLVQHHHHKSPTIYTTIRPHMQLSWRGMRFEQTWPTWTGTTCRPTFSWAETLLKPASASTGKKELIRGWAACRMAKSRCLSPLVSSLAATAPIVWT